MARGKTNKGKALDDPRFKTLGAPVEVRRHPKAQRLTLRVSRTHRAVIVTLPETCDLGEANSFVYRHIDWVKERLTKIPQPVPFADGERMPLRGEAHRMRFVQETGKRGVEILENQHDYPELAVYGPIERAEKRLRQWLFQQAKDDLDSRVVFHANRLRVKPKRLTVRDQTSRWGSCSSNGSLSFSWRLVMAPPFVLDYVAAHEVAHLREMNHGPRFWSLVEQTMPRMDEAKAWLQVYGMDLHRYGIANTD